MEALSAISRTFVDSTEGIKAEIQAELADTLRKVATELDANREKWEAKYGEEYPRELDDWIEQAVRAGVDPNTVCDTDWDVLVRSVQGYLLRVKDWHPDAPTKRAKGEPTPAETYAFNLYNHGVELWKNLPGNRDKKPTSKNVHEALKREHDAECVNPNAHSVFNPKDGLPKWETLRANASRYRKKMNLATLNES